MLMYLSACVPVNISTFDSILRKNISGIHVNLCTPIHIEKTFKMRLCLVTFGIGLLSFKFDIPGSLRENKTTLTFCLSASFFTFNALHS